MARPKANPTTSTEKIENTVEVENKENATESIDNVATENKEVEKTDKKNAKIDKIDDNADVTIVSKSRAGKKITSISLNVIEFDENGKATCKGNEAKYLVKSGLGFELA